MHATPHERPIEVYAPYVAEMVRQEMIARFGGDVLTKGYHVTTTIDPVLQAAADQAVRDGLAVYDHRHGWHGVEQHFDLAADEDAATARARLRGIPPQAGLLPAIVLRSGDGKADVVLADGTSIELGRARPAAGPAAARPPCSSAATWCACAGSRRRTDAKAGNAADARPRRAAATCSTSCRARSRRWCRWKPKTGALRALVGGFSFAGNKFNRATQARRQPGSSFKPFLYAAAFERGFNPASIVLDAPVVFKDRRGHMWRPQNDSGNFAGPMRLREALVQSRNLVSVRLLDAIGVDYARKYISQFGFDEASCRRTCRCRWAPRRCRRCRSRAAMRCSPTAASASRRGSSTRSATATARWCSRKSRRPPAAAAAQRATARGAAASNVVAGFDLGPAAPAPAPRRQATSQGAAPSRAATLPADAVLAPRAIDERVAYQLVSMMRDVVQRGTGTAAKVLGREDVGGKTGSTNDHRDAWFSGFGGDIVTTVWVGRDDFRSLGYREYGGKAALPIWIDYMRVALKDQPIAGERSARRHGQGRGRRRRPAAARQAAAASPSGSRPRTWNAWRATSTTARRTQPRRARKRSTSSEPDAGSGRRRRPRGADAVQSARVRLEDAHAHARHTPASTPQTRTRERRHRLAHEAARLMAEGGIRDFHQAKLKAAERLGIHRRCLAAAQPRDRGRAARIPAPVPAATRRPPGCAQRREAALRALEFFAAFDAAPGRPGARRHRRCQCAGRAAPVQRRRRCGRRASSRSTASRPNRAPAACAWTANAAEDFPVWLFSAEDLTFDLTVLPHDALRQAPLSGDRREADEARVGRRSCAQLLADDEIAGYEVARKAERRSRQCRSSENENAPQCGAFCCCRTDAGQRLSTPT